MQNVDWTFRERVMGRVYLWWYLFAVCRRCCSVVYRRGWNAILLCFHRLHARRHTQRRESLDICDIKTEHKQTLNVGRIIRLGGVGRAHAHAASRFFSRIVLNFLFPTCVIDRQAWWCIWTLSLSMSLAYFLIDFSQGFCCKKVFFFDYLISVTVQHAKAIHDWCTWKIFYQ